MPSQLVDSLVIARLLNSAAGGGGVRGCRPFGLLLLAVICDINNRLQVAAKCRWLLSLAKCLRHHDAKPSDVINLRRYHKSIHQVADGVN